ATFVKGKKHIIGGFTQHIIVYSLIVMLNQDKNCAFIDEGPGTIKGYIYKRTLFLLRKALCQDNNYVSMDEGHDTIKGLFFFKEGFLVHSPY
ncbi:hypothetical protein SUGI_1207720, partial [Cryptomeria japonica]